MPHIDYQKIKYDENHKIVSGSATLRGTVYDKNVKGRCKHPLIENLGKVVWISEDRKSGIFNSPTRGLVEYSSSTNTFRDISKDDSRINGVKVLKKPKIHTILGDSYLLLKFVKNTGLLDIMRTIFNKDRDFDRFICHLVHTIASNGSKESCDDYVTKNFMSNLIGDIPVSSLAPDTRYFTMMGDDDVKTRFFKGFIDLMRKKSPGFGHFCYVDSTPLPNDIENNPFNALSSHGVNSMGTQTRLVLVLDVGTGLPVWYRLIPGNVLDVNTIKMIRDELEEVLDISIYDMVLDAGYLTKNFIETYHLDSKPIFDVKMEQHKPTFVAKMPARKGFPFKTLYHEIQKLIPNAKYEFFRSDHTYFGFMKEVELFGKKEYAYIYVDKDNALTLGRKWRQENEDLYEKMTDKDKNWYSVKFGYFILVSNKKMEPKEILDEYFGRTQIETVFKTAKDYIQLLPLRKWTTETISGKILSDCICLIAYLMLQKKINSSSITTPKIFGRTQSLMCLNRDDGTVIVDTANKQVKEIYEMLDVTIPTSFKLAEFKNDLITMLKEEECPPEKDDKKNKDKDKPIDVKKTST